MTCLGTALRWLAVCVEFLKSAAPRSTAVRPMWLFPKVSQGFRGVHMGDSLPLYLSTPSTSTVYDTSSP